MPGILTASAKFLLFLAVLVIVVMPFSSVFSGLTKNHNHHSIGNRQKNVHAQYFEHGLHDISCDFINKRHLITPPVLLKIRAVTVICLLFSLFFINSGLASPKLLGFNFFSGKSPFPVSQKYLFYQTFLI
jgi:hypothetical protein